ncbi:hypothetical protein IGB42_04007 [Andreprevotia sp. IGB-42]|uniref:lipase secretion chaperone n=1 Tax=Andreprevotia sp. IGB-42 TaxID=2497473 RepID=UPI0013595907|nr:lipase secretion chaperone [Andreprevotia sp. IGB-42]KAF0811550.1 hypothetical protein IGB42_04007 [Andreprevotia sp. IGB-42]
MLKRTVAVAALLAAGATAAWQWWPAAAPAGGARAIAAGNTASAVATAAPTRRDGLFARAWGEAAPPPDLPKRLADVMQAHYASGATAVHSGQLQRWWRDGLALCQQAGGNNCERVLQDALASWPDQAAAAIARSAIAQLAATAHAEAQLVQSTSTPLSQRLAKLSALRKASMGEAAAEAWYGAEEAGIAFKAAVNEFAQGPAATMPQQARMARVEALRQQHYGSDYAELKAAESPQANYQIEYGLARLDARDAAADAALRGSLRSKYLPVADAQAQAQQEAAAAAQQARQQAYAVALAELDRRYPDHQDYAYVTALAALRKQAFE